MKELSILFVLVFSPLVFIWCVNTLFGCGIAYSFINWFAAFLLLGIGSGGSFRSNKS